LSAGDAEDLAGDVGRLLGGEEHEGGSELGGQARPSGVPCPNLLTFSAGIVAGMSGVQMGPGATAFTLMPRSATDWDRFFVKFTMAAFVEA
jgi:hypothetical protein